MYAIISISGKGERKVARSWTYLEPSDESTRFVNRVRDELARNQPGLNFVTLHSPVPAPDPIVTLEETPDEYRASHRAAGNWGRYPANGATRRLVSV